MRRGNLRIVLDLLAERSAKWSAPALVPRYLTGIAILAVLCWASSASAFTSFSVQGPILPGTHTYSIVMSYGASDRVQGFATSLITTGTYTDAISRTIPAPFAFILGTLTVTPGSSGIVNTWGGVSGRVNGPGGTHTIGTVEIAVNVGDTVNPFLRPGIDGFLVQTTGGWSSTVAPDRISGLTIVPEPTAAALLGLGILGLAASRKR